MKSIISCLGTQEFVRVRVGVGEKPKGYDLADYVLSHFSSVEKEDMQDGMIKAVGAVEMILSGDVDKAMSEYNRKEGRESKGPKEPSSDR